MGGGDNFVVYEGTSTSVYIYNLAPNTLYDVYVREYNDNTIFSTTTYYYNNSTSGASLGLSTLEAPASSCSGITSATSITNSSATINFTAGGGSGRFIAMNPTNLSVYGPTNGYYYTPSTIYGAGTFLGGGSYAMYNNSGTSVAVSGLAGATTYKVWDYEYTNGSYPTYSTYNYNTKNYTSCNSYTFNTTNFPPTLSAIPSYTICENTVITSVNLTGIGTGSTNETQNLSVTASSNNTTIFPGGSIGVYYTNPNTTGTIVMYPASGQYGTAVITVTVNDGWTVNNLVTKTFTVTILPFPGPATAISGLSPICAGTSHTYSIAATSNTTSYTWAMPSTLTVTAGAGTNMVTVATTSASVSGTMSVTPINTNGCGNGTASTKAIQVDAQPANPNAGPDQPLVCGSTAALNATAVTNPDGGVWTWLSGTPAPTPTTSAINSISITGLSGPTNTYKYVWTVTRAGSVCPSKTDTVTINTDWNNISCTPAAVFAYSPSSDVAPTKVCVNTPMNFTDLSVSANTWSWDFNYAGGAGVYTDFTQNPVYTYTTVGTYSVHLKIHSNTTGSNYTTTQTFDVIGAPATPGTIFGTTSGICQGSASQYVYSTGTVTNATGYNWSTPTGVHIDAYPSPTSIATSFYNTAISGPISVSASNSCGTSGTSTLNVTVSPLPNSAGNVINGPTTVCQSQNNVSYSISGYTNATSYTWIDLNGAQTTGTSTFTMNIGANAVSARIYVWGNNACGAGDTVALIVTVNPMPGAASGTAGSNNNITLCPNPGNLMYTVPAIANTVNYNWGLPLGASIVGGNGADTILINFVGTTTGGTHYVSVYGSNGCGNGAADSTSIVVNTPGAPQICMVTVDDSSSHNIVIWDKTNIAYADSFRIYREDVTNVYHQIGTVAYNSLSEFHDYDPIANPNVTTKRYKISSIDSCGNESAKSPYHNTIYITDNGSGQFSWIDLYTIENGANPVNNYLLMVDSLNNGNWYQRASTAGTQHVINDIYYNNYSTVANWYVETAWNISCTSTFLMGNNGTAGAVVKSKSNITNNRQIGIKTNSFGNLAMYPNPTNGNLTLNFASTVNGNATIKVTSIFGQEIYTQTIPNAYGHYEIDLSANENGTYIIQVITNKGVSTQRIIKQ